MMTETKVEYRVTPQIPPAGEDEQAYRLLREAGYTSRQLKMLAVITKALLRENQFGEIHLIFSKGKAMFIRPVPSMPFE